MLGFALAISFITGLSLAFVYARGQQGRTLKPFFDLSPIAMLILRADGRVLYQNVEWRKINGDLLLENALLDPFIESIGAKDAILRAIETGENQAAPILTVGQKFFSVTLMVLKSKDGEVEELMLRYTDVTRERLVDIELTERNLMFGAILNNSQALIYIKDRAGKYTLVNSNWKSILGLSAEATYGKTDGEIFPAEIASKFAEADLQVMTSGQSAQVEEFAPHADGLHCYLSLKFPIRNSKNEIVGVGGISYDITKQKETESERAELLIREKTAVEASVMKSIFLANMSHELRTPINGVMGMADLLLSTPLNPEQESFTSAIGTSAEVLLTLVNDILDLSKAEAGKIELESIDLKLMSVVGDVEKTLSLSARQKSLSLDFKLDRDLPSTITGDPTRVRQVLMNLVSNAIKFTDAGKVQIEIKKSLVNGADAICFEVTDTGIGIPENVLPKLFSDFSQADASTTRRFGGSGLGLSISKRLVNLMGGEIGVTRGDEHGTKAWFWFPLRVPQVVSAPEVAATLEATTTKRSLKILIAEDNKTNQLIAAKMLQKLGHQPVVVENGLEALTALRAGSYDLIFMDCQMPEMDGYEASRSIREGVTGTPSIPIVALTANAMRGDREKCLEAGMTDYISKPIKSVDLEHAIARLLAA